MAVTDELRGVTGCVGPVCPAAYRQGVTAHPATAEGDPGARRGDRGAAAVEYGLLAGGVVAAFLAAFIGLQVVLGGVFGRVVSSVERGGATDTVRTTPLIAPSSTPVP